MFSDPPAVPRGWKRPWSCVTESKNECGERQRVTEAIEFTEGKGKALKSEGVPTGEPLGTVVPDILLIDPNQQMSESL